MRLTSPLPLPTRAQALKHPSRSWLLSARCSVLSAGGGHCATVMKDYELVSSLKAPRHSVPPDRVTVGEYAVIVLVRRESFQIPPVPVQHMCPGVYKPICPLVGGERGSFEIPRSFRKRCDGLGVSAAFGGAKGPVGRTKLIEIKDEVDDTQQTWGCPLSKILTPGIISDGIMEPDELAAEQTLSRHRQHAVREPVVARGSGCRRRFTGIPPQRHDPIRIFHTLGPDGDGVLSNKSRGPLFLKHLAGSFVLFLAASNSQPMGRRPADARHALPRCPHCGAGPPQPTLESEPRFLMDGTPAALEPPLSPPKKTRGPLAVPFLQPVEKGTIPPVGRLPSLPFLSAPNRPSPTSSCPHSFWRQPHHTLLTHHQTQNERLLFVALLPLKRRYRC